LTGDDWVTALDDFAPKRLPLIDSGDGHLLGIVRSEVSLQSVSVVAPRLIDSGDGFVLLPQESNTLPAPVAPRLYDGGDGHVIHAVRAAFPIPDEIVTLMVALAREPKAHRPSAVEPVASDAVSAPSPDLPSAASAVATSESAEAEVQDEKGARAATLPEETFAHLPEGRPKGGLLYRDEGPLVGVLSHLFGSQSVETLRTSGFEWLIGPPNEATIPDFASLAQWVEEANRRAADAEAIEATGAKSTPARIGRYLAFLLVVLVVGVGIWLWPSTRVDSRSAVATAGGESVARGSMDASAATSNVLDSSLAVVNPQNVTATVAPEAGVNTTETTTGDDPSGEEFSGAQGMGVDALWPLAIAIVTPTPLAAERLLFSDPVNPNPEQVIDWDPAEQPIVLPARASEENGGIAMPAPVLQTQWEPRVVPAMAVALIPDLSTPTPTPAPSPTAPPVRLEPGRIWSSFAPTDSATHFWVGRPHPPSIANQIAAASYQFGSTGGGRYRPHHGMDIANTTGTPVRAATTGEVVHAGPDDVDLLGPYNDFYGNAVVIRLDRRLAVAGGEMDVYLLYGHLSEVYVQKGQRVQPDDLVGAVGMTGIAIGPHLHVEMRVGANVYEASVNPYLWVDPGEGNGAVAVRLLTADGRTWPRANVTIARFNGNLATWARVMEIYPDNESINPDPAFGENGAMEAVPAGVYYVVASVNGERVAGEVTVEAGKTTFIELRTQQ